MSGPEYAELHCLSDFSFGRGASSADELFERAQRCGYAALAITDECSLAGIVRAHQASQSAKLPLIVGAEFQLVDGVRFVLLVETLAGYEHLCRLITVGRRLADKGSYRLERGDLLGGLTGTLALWLPSDPIESEHGAWLRSVFADRLWMAVELHRDRDDAQRLAQLLQAAEHLGVRAVACGDVHMHERRCRALQDVLTATRYNLPVAQAGAHLFRNGERHLRARKTLANIYPSHLLAETVAIARRCRFTLDELVYRYPAELVPAGHTLQTWLRELTERGIVFRWPGGVERKVREQIELELALIAELGYEPYFLTVEDIVRFARSRGILCQGRGSAANSAVCFALGITEVDPARTNLVVERFISRERNEPPDIDIDFEHERREEVIQYVYGKYGRERAAIAATVISYRGKSAVRDVARALGFSMDQVQQLSNCFGWWSGEGALDDKLREHGFDPESAVMQRLVALTRELMGHPRHLSQHVGGFVITDAPLWSLVPVENAAMEDRTIIQWDKDDLDAMGLLKVDCLALGMLTCIRKALDLIRAHRGRDLTPATIPAEDPATYAMIQRAQTVGVFQIESRAQMTMLPRLQPTCFYDLVIEVAIVRPGPIQGGMVHPYLRRRQGLEPVVYPSEDLRKVLERTLGVPLFQEQVMQLAVVAAGYSGGEADQLRRSMAAWKRHGEMEVHRRKVVAGMLARGYTPAFAEQLFEQMRGFGSYGFPESHSASFALLVYVSAWLKCHEPAAFVCALLNSQPMGFYTPNQLTQEARRNGIDFRSVDVTISQWDCALEDGHALAQPAVRLGFREIAGIPEEAAKRIVAARALQAFRDIADCVHRSRLDERQRRLLVDAGAFAGLSGHRHHARWESAGVEPQRPLLPEGAPETDIALPAPSVGEDVLADYRALGFTLGTHPLALIRDRLNAKRCAPSNRIKFSRDGARVRAAGLVALRQRPSTASGTTFVTLEDEFGTVDVIVWQRLCEQQRRELLDARLLAVNGRWESHQGVSQLIATRLEDLTPLLGMLPTRSRDFH